MTGAAGRVDLPARVGAAGRTTGPPVETALAKVAAFYDSPESGIIERLLGEDLHRGAFDPAVRARQVDITADHLVLEVACGTGCAARHLAASYGCRVVATNLATRQLGKARQLTEGQALNDLVSFGCCDFHSLPFGDGQFDFWWAQDSLLHALDRHRVLREARRVLKTGGIAVFSDFIIRASAGKRQRQRILERVQTPSMWDGPDYDRALRELGFRILKSLDWSRHIDAAYSRMKRRIESCRKDLLEHLDEARLIEILTGIEDWLEQSRRGNLGWVCYVAGKR